MLSSSNAVRKEFTPQDGLTDSEKQFFLEKSRIGFGFNSDGDVGPKYTNRPVVADIPLSRIGFDYSNEAHRDIVTAYCSFSSAFLRAGWTNANLVAKTPWVDGQIDTSFSDSSANSQLQKRVYVTGRHYYTHGKIYMKDYVARLEPHPEFEKAVMDALANPNEAERTQEIQDVLKWYGSMFVASVEVGGMKHSTIERTLDEKTTESSAKREMTLELTKQFGPAEVGAKVGGGNENKQTLTQDNESDSVHFYTVGGAIEAPSLAKSPIGSHLVQKGHPNQDRPCGLQDTALPVQELSRKALFEHRSRPSKLSANYGDQWANDGSVGTVLTAPVDGSGAVPLYHAHDQIRHVFTNDLLERNNHTGSMGFRYDGIECYVHTTPKPGTVRLNRTWRGPFFYDNAYSTTKEALELQKQSGYGVDDYFNCYIYPA
ncbi:hypothetical protein FRC01_003142 [Tulasnella sp. 417]|nr:hypothetical protein FRC01_003142 [Tulasnella sp. 417]